MPIVLKSGSLNLLETSGPVQACKGIALPLPYYYYYFCKGSGLQTCSCFISSFYLDCMCHFFQQENKIPVRIVHHSLCLSLHLSLLSPSPAVQWPGHEADHLSQSRADVKYWSYIKTHNRYTFVDRQYLLYSLLVFALSHIIKGTI